ncbi:unnamed protein product [Auanema sp. JU1783]|nr:unnamed protein product [Auanema sp. JU1783]
MAVIRVDCEQAQVHQPRMKVFTVGLGDKDGTKKADPVKSSESTAEMTKIPIDSNTSSPSISPAPIIISRSPPARKAMMRSCGILSWCIGAFFIVLLCLTISEISYNRQRDQAYLRLKWAELRQRMLGYELLSQVQQQQQQKSQNQPLDERLAFSNRPTHQALPLLETPTISNNVDNEVTNDIKKSEEDMSTAEGDARFVFLRNILEKMRKKASEMGLNGDMQVHVIEVKPIQPENERDGMSQRAWEDGFGEVAVPKQHFGPFPHDEDYVEYDRAPKWNQPQWDRRPQVPEFEENYQDNFLFNDNFERPNGEAPFMPDNRRWPMGNQWAEPNPMINFPQMPTIGRQNQFPFPVQNQVPIIGTANEQQQAQRPWYMSGGDDERFAHHWNNDWSANKNKQEFMPFQPNPVGSNMDSKPFNPWMNSQDSEGIDNFQRQESFNVPIDVAVDDKAQSVEKSDSFQTNTWQHTQAEPAKETEPASLPIVSSNAQVGSLEEKDFLPVRSEEILEAHMDHSDKVIIHDDEEMDKKFKSPFFQIDYPN